MQSPSNSQLKAIQHGEGPMLVIIQRILNLIHEKQVRPENILVISFSKASTLELKQRFQKELSKVRSKSITNKSNENNKYKEKLENESDKHVHFSTFHACFFHILKETYHYTSQDIITEKQKKDLIKTVLANPKCTEEKIEEYLSKISYYKNQDKNEISKKESKEFQKIFQEYNREMHLQHKLDFDDMGLMCLQLFQAKSEILEKWQEKFQYILIDEFQDINTVQFQIICLLARKYQNLLRP